jgi:hypothetical protein
MPLKKLQEIVSLLTTQTYLGLYTKYDKFDRRLDTRHAAIDLAYTYRISHVL